MDSLMISMIVLWAVLAAVVLVLAFWRRIVSASENDAIHVTQTGEAQQQLTLAHRLEQIDKWGKILTVVVVVFGLILASVYFYKMWVASSSLGV